MPRQGRCLRQVVCLQVDRSLRRFQWLRGWRLLLKAKVRREMVRRVDATASAVVDRFRRGWREGILEVLLVRVYPGDVKA
jgi:hypothetical protein